MQRTLLAGAIAAPMILAYAANAEPVLFYQQDFEGRAIADVPEWSGFVYLADNVPLSRFLGPSAQKITTLTVPIPQDLRDSGNPGGGDDTGGGGETRRVFALEFDLYIIDSWGYSEIDPGDDFFRVYHNGETVFDEIFSNTVGIQTYREPDERGSFAYSPTYEDSVYRDVRIEFELPAESDMLQFDFIANTTLPWQDESFGIDNIRIGYDVVPSPGPLALLGLGGVALARRRRNG